MFALDDLDAFDVNKMARQLKKSTRAGIRNFLRSIIEDSNFVNDIHGRYPGVPMWANLRNGMWLAPRFEGAAYFKSADGHPGAWTFSVTRLNLHFATAAFKHKACLLVDSTRRYTKCLCFCLA